jgi:hypothetical protein
VPLAQASAISPASLLGEQVFETVYIVVLQVSGAAMFGMAHVRSSIIFFISASFNECEVGYIPAVYSVYFS